MKKVEQIDLNELVKDYQIKDIDTFSKYLIEIWRDLAHRSSDQAKGLEKLTFSNYYDLPGIISDRLFAVLDKNKNGYLDPKEFIEGMLILFNDPFEKLIQFIFKFYDFDHDGFITREDVRVVLSYVPLQGKFKKYKMRFEQNEYKDRVESQNELFDILNVSFGKKEKLNEEEFTHVIENVSSEIFIFILMYLLENKPFTNESIKIFIKNLGENSTPEQEVVSRTPKMDTHKIASPSLKSRFLSPTLKKRAVQVTKSIGGPAAGGGAANLLNLYSMNKGGENKGNADPLFKRPVKGKLDALKNLEKDIASNNPPGNGGEESARGANQKMKQPNRRARKLLGDLEDKPVNSTGFTLSMQQGQNGKKNDKNGKDSDDEDNNEFEATALIKHEGYMYKLTHTKKLKRVYFVLIGRDFYYFKNKEDQSHKGMHNLSGIYISKGEPTVIEDKKLYNFSILYPQKERTYYIEDENEFY